MTPAVSPAVELFAQSIHLFRSKANCPQILLRLLLEVCFFKIINLK